LNAAFYEYSFLLKKSQVCFLLFSILRNRALALPYVFVFVNRRSIEMPTYEYRCENCGYEMEAFQSMKDEPLKKCPECSKNKLKRLIGTGAGIIFKGSGFYETDYRSDSYKKAEQKDKSGSSSSDSKKATDSGSKEKPKDKKDAKAGVN
jgi:putative FmdB family regulatory protein